MPWLRERFAEVSFVVMMLIVLALAPARAADLPIKAPSWVPVSSGCTQLQCSGWYGGFNIMGVGSNMDILGSGINGSVFAGGGSIGLQGGYQFWNGDFFFAAEAFGDYTVNGNPVIAGTGSQPRYVFGQLAKFGGKLSALFGASTTPGTTTPTQGTTPIAIPSSLSAALISPYVQFGAVERPWGSGWATGAGAEFVIASGWNLDLSYLYVKYANPNLNLVQSEASENLIKLSLNRKF